MATPIFTHLEGRIPLLRHEHVAVVYRGEAAAFRLAPFLAEGLERGDVCRFLAPAGLHEEMRGRLQAQVGDLDRHFRSATLEFHRGLQEFRELLEWARKVFADAESRGAPAVRWLEDGVWPTPVGLPMTEFFEFHALLNYQVKHYPSLALCQYDLNQIEPPHLFSAIAVHRHLLVGDTLVRDNPYYIPAEKFIPLSPGERERDLAKLFQEVGCDVERLLAALVGYGRLQHNLPQTS